MPELPEVETIRRQLSSVLVGKKIVSYEVRRAKIWEGRDPSGEVISAISRVGKYLFVYFESGRGLAIHLKMTGRLVYGVKDYMQLPHTRVVISFEGGDNLYYWDSRTFGYLHHIADISTAEENQKKKMGKEPFVITDSELYSMLKKTGRYIKDVILDQKILAGVGNIYASDALWSAGIKPKRRANSLTQAEVKRLRTALVEVLQRGLLAGGASDNSYVDAKGERGSYQEQFLTYRRRGLPCLKCGRLLQYGKVSGRGSWWCEECQK